MAVNDQLDRFGKGRTLKENHLIGDPDHIGEHGKLLDALASIAAAAGKSYTIPLPPKRHLGDGSHTADHNSMLAAVAEAASWPAWNAATGGTVTDVPNYNGSGQLWRVHRYGQYGPGIDAFTVTRATQPFRVLLGGGARGGHSSGCCGSCAYPMERGQLIESPSYDIAVGTHTVTIGAGGDGGGWTVGGTPGGLGQNSVFTVTTALGGGVNGANGPQITSDIAGAGAVLYSINSHGGGCGDHMNGGKGDTGLLIVAYRIG
jgi:hypothetical protein